MTTNEQRQSADVFEQLPLTERVWVLRQLRDETVGGGLLIMAALIALILANSPGATPIRSSAISRSVRRR